MTFPAVIHEKKDLGEEYRKRILKYTPQLRDPLYNLTKAADYLEDWVNGVLPLLPPIDVSA